VIAGQQLSVASAGAIWQRLQARVQPFAVAPFLALPEEDLRRAGLSAAKISTLHRVANAIDAGALDLDALTNAPEEAIHERLTAVKGIAPWTADPMPGRQATLPCSTR
jgi:DNA-3-methyladenine glycosylase II